MTIKVKNYLRNPKLKQKNAQISFTEEQVREYAKCMDDPLYFAKNYIKIVNVDRGLMPFEMYDWQEELIRKFQNERRVIVLCSRQIGKSITTVSYILWEILFKDNQRIAILAHKNSAAKKMLADLKLAYENLPLWLQQGVVEWNKGSIELENGSKVVSAATGSSAARGGSFNIVVLDEYAFVSPSIADEFFASVYPTISSGQTTKLFMISTPNGHNHFYHFWQSANLGTSEFKPFKALWHQVPWKDQAWAEKEKGILGARKFSQEHDCLFLGAENSLIGGDIIEAKIKVKQPTKIHLDVNIFEEPKPNRTYVMTVDTANGTGNDYSTFTIFDISSLPFKQVATYQNNKIDDMVFPDLINSVGMYYNGAYVLIENNGEGNGVGASLFKDLEYENLLWSKLHNKKLTLTFGGGNADIGVKLNHSIKNSGCQALKSLIENDQITIVDQKAVSELSNFVRSGPSFSAAEGHHDDLVMNCVLFAWLTRQEVFAHFTNVNLRDSFLKKLIPEETLKEEEQDLPFAFRRTGGKTTQLSSKNESNNFWHVRK